MARHVSADKGVVYVAGGTKMARAVRNELVEILGERVTGGERKAAKQLLKKMTQRGTFRVEVWS